MKHVRVWDPLLRGIHWAVAAGFLADALFIEDETALHETVGYTVLALVGLRLAWGVIGPRHARFSDFPPDPGAALAQLGEMASGRLRRHLGHSPLGALMIYNLLVSLLLIGLTGWMMTTNAYWGSAAVEEAHEGLVLWAGASALLHVGAVLFESRRTGVNLPRAMVTGYKDLPDDGERG